MLGNSGVGKSVLAMVLAGEEFRATEPTHARRIWPLPATEDLASPGGNRDILLWDLAGQPGYRIVHQLHLPGAAQALILFDAKSETAPLAGVQHWARGQARPPGGDRRADDLPGRRPCGQPTELAGDAPQEGSPREILDYDPVWPPSRL